ncbi:cysteine synthase family protein [Kibdelosporangium philippinense]|uniref:Cysteine synthase family protein n=2 Tax=Kibdelosporangium philippinense TaxID=211113 RepID=A0ABS8ZGJ9_9PSEU|nr:cysteine synthase family protein [Kibdelosporangium philippinense]MCE7006960.1 cysteine synthase family protein [Kibdelosporangium philippinense]
MHTTNTGTVVPHLLDAIGSTTTVSLTRLTRPGEADLVAKLESGNPGGSLKDRPAAHILRHAERAGYLRPGGTIIESSSGNFGIALAMFGAARGYRVIAVVDPKLTPTNRALLEAFGAQIIVVDEPDDAGSYHKTRIALANRLHREIPNSFRPDQCFNPLNSDAHYRTTAEELLAQCGPELSAIVCTVSTGGHLGGIARLVKHRAPHITIIGVDVEGSTVFGGTAHPYLTPGMGLSWTPANLDDLSRIDAVYQVSDEHAYRACRTLARAEGILAGVSTGAALIVALAAALHRPATQRVALLANDRGERYLTTAFNDEWLRAHSLTTDTSVDRLRAAADRLRPTSTRVAQECANYRPDLATALGTPTTTHLPANAR